MNYDSLNTGWIKRHHLTTRQKQNTPLWMKSTSFFNELTARTVQAEKPCSEIQRPTELVNWTYFDISATPYIKHFITYLNHFIVISKTNCKASRQLVWTPLIVMFALRDAPFSMCLYVQDYIQIFAIKNNEHTYKQRIVIPIVERKLNWYRYRPRAPVVICRNKLVSLAHSKRIEIGKHNRIR